MASGVRTRCCRDPARTASLFAEAIGLDRLLRFSKRWLELTARKTAARLAKSCDGGARFAAPFPVPARAGGFRVVFLDCLGALAEEGLRMSHCIAMLYPECAQGRRLAFSLRNPAGSSCATFDISLVRSPRGAQAVVNELRAAGNESAPEECRKAVEEFVAEVDALLQGDFRPADRCLAADSGGLAAVPAELAEEATDRAKREALYDVLAETEGIARLLKDLVQSDSPGLARGGRLA